MPAKSPTPRPQFDSRGVDFYFAQRPQAEDTELLDAINELFDLPFKALFLADTVMLTGVVNRRAQWTRRAYELYAVSLACLLECLRSEGTRIFDLQQIGKLPRLLSAKKLGSHSVRKSFFNDSLDELLGWMKGLEPSTTGATIQCSTN